jgi:hypothetical protein
MLHLSTLGKACIGFEDGGGGPAAAADAAWFWLAPMIRWSETAAAAEKEKEEEQLNLPEHFSVASVAAAAATVSYCLELNGSRRRLQDNDGTMKASIAAPCGLSVIPQMF